MSSSIISKAIIPAAGLGTRLLPATKAHPKEMLPIGRKPALQYVVEELQAAKIHDILMVTGRRKRSIEDHFDADPPLVTALKQAGNEALLQDLDFLEGRSHFFFTRQSEPKGLGHAVSLGAGFVEDQHCVVALGDSLIAGENPAAPLLAMMQAHVELNAAAMIAVEIVPAEETFRYGIVDVGDRQPTPGEPMVVQDIVEKPPAGTAPSRLAVAARYVFSPVIFEALERIVPDGRGELQLTDAIRWLVRMEQPVYAWLLDPVHKRYDVGNFESYYRAFIDFALADERYGYLVRKYIKSLAYEF